MAANARGLILCLVGVFATRATRATVALCKAPAHFQVVDPLIQSLYIFSVFSFTPIS